MFTLRLCRNVFLASLLFCSLVAGPAWAANPSGDGLLEMIPAKCLFCVRVNNLDQTLAQIDQFLTGISPIGLAMPVRAFFANVLGNPQLNGVNMAGSFAVFGPLPSSETGGFSFGILVPVTDYKQFTETNPNVSKPDANGISKTATDKTKGPPLSIVQVKNCALFGLQGTEKELVATAQAIKSGQFQKLAGSLDTDELKLAATEPLWVYGDIQLVGKMFGPMLFAKLEEAKKTMQQLGTKGQPPMGNMSAIMNIYTDILKTLLNETKFISLVVRPRANVLSISTNVSAMPGTDMAAMFVTDASSAGKNRLLPYLRDGAMMSFAFKPNTAFSKKMNGKQAEFMTSMVGPSVSAEDVAKMKALTVNMTECLGDSAAVSILLDSKNKPPFAVQYIIAIKDESKFYKLVDEATVMMNTGAIAELYKSLGMKLNFAMKRGTDRYKNSAIDSMRFAITSTDPNSQVGQMINTIYGNGFDIRLAIVDGLCVYAMGGDPNAAIRSLIDQVKAGGPTGLSPEIKAAFDLLPQAEKADFLGTFNFLREVQIGLAIMPIPIPQMDVPSKSNIAFAATAGRGKMTVDIAVPKDHLMEIVQFFQKMQQQQMQIQQQKAPQPVVR